MQFELTPKALANFSPEVRASQNPGYIRNKSGYTLKGFRTRRTLSGFNTTSILKPRVVASSNPGLKLANAFGVNSNCITTQRKYERLKQPGVDFNGAH